MEVPQLDTAGGKNKQTQVAHWPLCCFAFSCHSLSWFLSTSFEFAFSCCVPSWDRTGEGEEASVYSCLFFFSLHFVESFLPQMVFIKNQTKNINSKNTANYKLPSPTDRGKLNAWCVLGIDLRCHGTAVLSVWGSKDSSKVFRRQKEHTWIWLPCSEKRWKIRLG